MMLQPRKAKKGFFPTVNQVVFDELSVLARKNWAPTLDVFPPFDVAVVKHIYWKSLRDRNQGIREIMLLEFSQYLENYLWPNFKSGLACIEHVMSIAVMVNEKWRDRNPAWEAFIKDPEEFPGFFKYVLNLTLDSSVSLPEKTTLILFLMHCFNSIEVDLIRLQVQKLLSLSTWHCLLPGRLEQELDRVPKLRKLWKLILKNDKKLDEESLTLVMFERTYLKNLLDVFMDVVKQIESTDASLPIDKEKLGFCERFLEMLIDMEVMLPTRRFFNTLLDNENIVVKLEMCRMNHHPECALFTEMLDILKFYAGFEIDDHTGDPLTEKQMMSMHYNRVTALQRAVFKLHPELKKFSISSVSSVDTREKLLKHFRPLTTRKLQGIAALLNLCPEYNDGENKMDKKILLEMIASRHERRLSQLQKINNMALYPTEDLLWDDNVIPSSFYTGGQCLALPKLNLQFLTFHDYLLRNFHLFRLEATYEIREEIEDVISRLKPWSASDGDVSFSGWARYGMPLTKFTRFEILPPKLGQMHPAKVTGDVTVTLSVRHDLKAEWEGIRKFDTAFLVTVRPDASDVIYPTAAALEEADFRTKYGVVYVRGIEFEGMLDESGKLIDDFPDKQPYFTKDQRTFRVQLDPCQYQIDMDNHAKGEEDVYESFNVIIRRNPKNNNFKAVLETMRDLMNTECVVPDWLHDIILGYGDPAAAHYSNMEVNIPTLDWNDTFLDWDHLTESFPEYQVKTTTKDPADLIPPFKLTFKDLLPDCDEKTILVEPHVVPNRGPYPYDEPKRNTILFTPTQIEAIKSGTNHGLTMIVGPPGTGKTDVAVQIISNIYHNFPNQRTLLVTHSNQALNQLFEKIIALDIDERHCLRLGHGMDDLETEKDFGRYGRVNFVLGERMQLLKEVSRLQASLGISGEIQYTCETAAHFFLYQVMSRWEQYWDKITSRDVKLADVYSRFPFHAFFANAPQPVFRQESLEEDIEIAEGCWRHIRMIFTKLEEYRAFELLRTGSERSKYLLVKEAKIIAMTCTHAALKRRDLVQVMFQYDNILMEEAAQILEIETFIPLLLQNPKDGHNRLKRWVMIGDHNQLPPVVKNMSFQKYSNMEQSLFTRLVRLGVPTVTLDAQGRARASLSQLYSWRYDSLGNLPHVQSRQEFRCANAGFCFEFQAINVPDLNGIGETQPAPYFYQNLAEAEYVVATYIYMRLIGYPADKITILTQYNGQKSLLMDVVEKKCSQNPLIGPPHKVETVDKYQGQQNDYILLSLTRTTAVGHLRDARRLIVAMSRARLGLYVFARVELFKNCIELSPVFVKFAARPLLLHLAPTEMYPTERLVSSFPNPVIINDVTQMCYFVHDMYEQKRRALYPEYQPAMPPAPPQKEYAAPPTVISANQPESEAEVQSSQDNIQSENAMEAEENTGEDSQNSNADAVPTDEASEKEAEESSAVESAECMEVATAPEKPDEIPKNLEAPVMNLEEDMKLLNQYDDIGKTVEAQYNTDT